MMDRRRALMGQDRSLLFSVVNKSIITPGERIHTEVKVLKYSQKYTILIDLTNTSNPTTGNSGIWKVIVAWNSRAGVDGISLGKDTTTASLQKITWQKPIKQGTKIPNSNPSPGRHRYCLLREADSYITLKYKKNNNEVETVIASGSLTEAPTSLLNFGDTSGSSGLPPGTFTAFVYNRILTQEEIDAFFA